MQVEAYEADKKLPLSIVFRNSLKLSVEGNNLFVISNGYNCYFDPETYGKIYAQPIAKSVTLGFNLTF
ncbi:hypothetical protein [Faecalibacter sp. LW9]|uniref:hypothetical protein n=1 Tax=Faecalibacter sp. LW9 TaxID=3103144 RepID=UPI002AFDDB05|nr:hypothetical protein [Faecalibacter sp. LW9]